MKGSGATGIETAAPAVFDRLCAAAMAEGCLLFTITATDPALTTSMGLGSCLNIPVQGAGTVVATVNVLAEAHHFTPARLRRYHAMTAAEASALAEALRAG